MAESDKLAAQEIKDADDNARRRRREKLREMLQKMEVCEFIVQHFGIVVFDAMHILYFAIPYAYSIVFLYIYI